MVSTRLTLYQKILVNDQIIPKSKRKFSGQEIVEGFALKSEFDVLQNPLFHHIIEGFSGPGRVGRELQLDRSFYGENLVNSQRIWLEDAEPVSLIYTSKRMGIEYSGEWAGKLWRFYL